MLSTVGARGSLEASQETDNFEKYQVDRAGLLRHRDAFNLNESELCEMLLNWILDHEDEVNQSERWRTQNQKKNAKRFDKIDKGEIPDGHTTGRTYGVVHIVYMDQSRLWPVL